LRTYSFGRVAQGASEAPLAGRVLVVDAASADAAVAAASAGATIVVASRDAAVAGAVAAQVRDAGGRVAVFTGDLARSHDRAALIELLDELFGERSSS
jgi:hypothetical protein